MNGFDEYRRTGLDDSIISNELNFLDYQSDESDEKKEEKKEESTNILPSQPENEKEENENIQNEDEDEEREEHCAYCGIVHKGYLIKCNDKTCQRWFCNGCADEYSASHIVFHLTKAKHKEVITSSDCPIPETLLKCYHCDSTNIFLLGFLQSKDGESAIILCREPCLTKCKIEDENFDKSNWKSMITEKRILNTIIPFPEDRDLRICQNFSIRQMSKLEDKWQKEIQNKGKQTNNRNENDDYNNIKLKNVKLTYEDGQDYLETFEPLIQHEEEYDRKIKENQKKQQVNVVFNKKGKKIMAVFIFPREDNEIKLVPGDELKIYDSKSTKSYKGYIIKMEINDEVILELEKIFSIPMDGLYFVEIVWKGTSFKRMLDGLYTFANDKDSISSYLYHKILGHEVEDKKTNLKISTDLTIKGLPELNFSQNQAIKKALQTPLFLIQGPPGTGKTVTSSAIVYHLAKSNQKSNNKVLVCAPSNIAADQLAEKISKTGLNVIRVCSKSREAISTNVENLSLHFLIREKGLNSNQIKRLNELIKKREDEGDLNNDNYELYKKLKAKAENEVIYNADVIVTTCVTALDKRLKDFRFPFVLVDEATQACESECLIPLLKGAKHVILVGDHCQLGPVILCKNAARAGMKMSLFERLIKLKVKPHMLQVQYRMHPKLSEFPSNTFYNGNLQNGVNGDERTHHSSQFNWPNRAKPMFFYHILGVEQFSSSGTSYINQKEAEFIEKAVTSLLKSNIKPEQIGIITPYEGQRSFIVAYMLKNGSVTTSLYKDIEVASVDSYQGREKDYIILSCVRSNDNHGIGFLNDPKRLNVALTRSRYGLIIVGNSDALSKHQLWNNLLYHFKQNSLLVEGGLQGFREKLISLKPPERYLSEKQCFESEMNENNLLEDLDSNKLINRDIDMFNDATISRFSDFGYVNDRESMDHYNHVRELLKKQSIRNQNFDKLRSKFDSIGLSQMQKKITSILNNQSNLFSNSMNNQTVIDKLSKMKNMIQSNPVYSNQYEKIKSNLNNLFSSEKQFVMKTEF